MSKTAKNLKIAVLAVAMIACLAFGMFFAIDRKVAKADVMSGDGEFTIAQGAQARISTNCGIRFTAYFDDTFYNDIVDNGEIKSGYELGMIIVPSSYFEDYYEYIAGTDYDGGFYNYFSQVKGKMIDLNFSYANIREDATLGYCVNGAVVNMKSANLDRDYSAIGYLRYTTGGVSTYRYTSVSLPRSIRYIAAQSVALGYVTSEQEATLDSLYDIAGKGSYRVNTYLQKTTLDGYVLNARKTLYLSGNVGDSLDYSSTYPKIDGYYLNSAISTLTGTVSSDGSTEINLYYSLDGSFGFGAAPSNTYDTISTVTDVVYNGETSSTKMTFKNHKYANFNITSLEGISNATGGYITFYIKNETGVALDYYSDYHLSENGGVSRITASSEWQKAKLYVDKTGSDTITVYLRSYNELTALSGGQAFYISTINMDEEAAVNTATVSGYAIAPRGDTWSVPSVVATSTDYVYGNETSSHKIGFNVGRKYANFSLTYPAGDYTGYDQLGFYIYNDTGVALDIYTDPGAWSGVVSVSGTSGWQKITLYANYTATGGTVNVALRGKGETVVNSSEIKYVYISQVGLGEKFGIYNVNAASIRTSEERKFGDESSSTKIGFTAGAKYANFNVQYVAGASAMTSFDRMDFWVYNDTGAELEAYTSPEAWSGIAIISANTGWQNVSLYVGYAAGARGTVKVNLRTKTEKNAISNTEVKYVYVSQIKFTEENNVYAGFSSSANVDKGLVNWQGATASSSSERTFNGKDTLKLNLSKTAYAAGVWLNRTANTSAGARTPETKLAHMLSKIGTDDIESITLSFYYDASQVTINTASTNVYLGLSVGNAWDVVADKSIGWHKYSCTLTSAPANFILHVSTKNSAGYDSTVPIGGVLYISDIEYKINYSGDTVDYSVDSLRDESGNLASFTSAANVTANASTFVGSFEFSSDAERGNVIHLTGGANGRVGFRLNGAKAHVNSLLATDGVAGVKVSFKWKVSSSSEWTTRHVGIMTAATNYTAPIGDNKDVWMDFETTITATMPNFIIGCYYAADCSWQGYGINADAYFTDVLYEVIYESDSVVAHDDASDYDYIDVGAGTKLADFNLNLPAANATDGITFKLLNKTGRKLYVYTDSTAWSGKVEVANSKALQTVNLYVPTSATSVKVYFKTVDGKAFNPTLVSRLYFGDYESYTCPATRGTNIVSAGATDYQIVYANDASEAEINAATRLKTYMDESTGFSFGLTKYSARDKSLRYIGVGDGFFETTALDSSEANAYSIKKVDGNLYIYGVADSGTSWGVMDFLADYFGYIYTDSEYTIDSVTTLDLSSISEVSLFTPTVSMRAYIGYGTMTNVFNGVWKNQSTFNQELSFNTNQNTNWVKGVWDTSPNWPAYSGALTKFAYVGAYTHNTQLTLNRGVDLYNAKYGTSYSASTWYSTNTNNACDICLTKKYNGITTIELVSLALEDLIEKNYANGIKYYIFQKSDYADSICTCDTCKGYATALKGKSGLQNWFVNNVIAKIDADGYADYDYHIVTYAYQDVINAPTAVSSKESIVSGLPSQSNVAGDKVVIQFAFIDEDYHYGVYDSRSSSKAIIDAWQNYYSGETWFWLYDTDFSYYAGYFPALNCIADNVYAAKKFNASAVFINGAHDAPHDWDSKLRRYVYSRMLWDFDETEYLKGDANSDGVNDYVKSVAMEYLNSYYGTANAALVWEIIQCYEASSANKTVKSGGKSTYTLGRTFYNDRFSNIFFGNGSTTGVFHTTGSVQRRLKEVMLSIAADLYYIGGVDNYNNSDVSAFFGTTNVRMIFKMLADEVGFTQWSEDYAGDGSKTVAENY